MRSFRQQLNEIQQKKEESEGYDNVLLTELNFRVYSIQELAGRVRKLIKEDEEVVKE